MRNERTHRQKISSQRCEILREKLGLTEEEMRAVFPFWHKWSALEQGEIYLSRLEYRLFSFLAINLKPADDEFRKRLRRDIEMGYSFFAFDSILMRAVRDAIGDKG